MTIKTTISEGAKLNFQSSHNMPFSSLNSYPLLMFSLYFYLNEEAQHKDKEESEKFLTSDVPPPADPRPLT